MKCQRNALAGNRVLRFQVLRAVLPHDLDAGFGERRLCRR